MILETNRLYLREMEQSDFNSLCKFLQDIEVMYAYEHAFSNDKVQAWLDNQIRRYKQYGFGLWAIIKKDTNECIGDCGLTYQDFNGKEVLEIGYHLQKKFWHQGFATEVAIACKEYAFNNLKANEVFSIIRDNNIPSQKVAIRNGMTICGEFTKHYYNMDMPHWVYSIKNNNL